MVSISGGALGGLAYPNFNLWPAIFISFSMIFLSVRGVGFFRGFWLGLISGFFFYLSGIYWLSLYLGPEPLIALSLLESIFFGFGSAFIALIWSKFRFRTASQAILTALALATVETAREWVSSHLPYGGFPWMRISQALADSWLSRWVFLGGLPLLSFLGAFVSAIIAVLVANRKWAKRQNITSMLGVLAAIALVPLFVNPPTSAENGYLKVAGIQGNAKAGLFANEEWGSILRNHLSQTQKLFKSEPRKSLDLVIWPENAADISPLDFPQAAAKIKNLVDSSNTPLLFGTTRSSGENIYNSSVLWLPQKGISAIYDKRRPVPFAEYVPDRPFWNALAPSLIGLIQRGFSPGHRSGVFELNKKRLGVLICFEIAIDGIGNELVDSGAQVIISQTNNADFGHSAETYQQASLAKLQAIATGRAVVNISTVGVSALFLPDGTVTHQLPAFQAASLVASVPLRTSSTPAHLLGVYLELVINLSAMVVCLLALLRTRKTERPSLA